MKNIIKLYPFSFGILTVLSIMGMTDAFAYTISDDSTGGDCSIIGVWDSESKTCTLSGNVNEGIVIRSNGITLDGNSFSLIGNGGKRSGNGIDLLVRTSVSIKNISVENFNWGIYLEESLSNTISSNLFAISHFLIPIIVPFIKIFSLPVISG